MTASCLAAIDVPRGENTFFDTPLASVEVHEMITKGTKNILLPNAFQVYSEIAGVLF